MHPFSWGSDYHVLVGSAPPASYHSKCTCLNIWLFQVYPFNLLFVLQYKIIALDQDETIMKGYDIFISRGQFLNLF